jgi:uncharacterized protein (TIGR02145 family)
MQIDNPQIYNLFLTTILNIYTNMRRRMIFWMLTLLSLSAVNVNAQVTIGSMDDPHGGAVLDLSKANGPSIGLLLSRISLENVDTWQLGGDENGGDGMVVYNTNNDVVGGAGAGIYVWIGNVWTPVKSNGGFSGTVKAMSFDLTPSATNINIYEEGTQEFTVGNFMPENAVYQGVTWSVIDGNDKINIIAQNPISCTIQGISIGTATLQVTSIDQNVSKTITIEVSPVTLKSFSLNTGSLILNIGGKTETITADDFIGTNDLAMSGVTVEWSIVGANTTGSTISPATGNTATVTSGGTVGSFTVRATVDGITRDCEVTTGDCVSVTDSENNTYSAAKFGAAGCWMTQNLRSKKYANGTSLAQGSNTDNNAKYYNYPNSNTTSPAEYGLLYTWAAAADRTNAAEDSGSTQHQGICPNGWHLPSRSEWYQLEETIAKSATGVYSTTGVTPWESSYIALEGSRGAHGQKMKSATAVTNQITNGTSNSYGANGFDAMLVGYISNGSSNGYGAEVRFWSSTSGNTAGAWRWGLHYDTNGTYCINATKYFMYSVRCIKDSK